MNKAVANIELADRAQAVDMDTQRERLSALADGELEGAELADALAYAGRDEAMADWQLYHLVGDVLRSSELAQPVDTGFMNRLRTELAKEPLPVRVQEPVQVAVVAPAAEAAATAAVFRWTMAAGCAARAAVAAIGWSSLSSLQGGMPGQGPAGAQLAQQSPELRQANTPAISASPTAPVVAVADADGQQVMIRDPRLDELLAAHKQFGSTSALQMPAGFLRNATFETPSR